MRIGLFSDVHGNPHGAREAIKCLHEAAAECLYFLGDAVGYFGKPSEALAALHDNGVHCLKGNHEQMILSSSRPPHDRQAVYNYRHTLGMLSSCDKQTIDGWPETIELTSDGYRLLLVHGSPFDHLNGYLYPDSDLATLANLEYDIICCAHTHRPFVRRLADKTIINAGSAGFRRDNGRFLNCCLVDTATNSVEIIEYPFPADQLGQLKPFHEDLLRVLQRTAESHEPITTD